MNLCFWQVLFFFTLINIPIYLCDNHRKEKIDEIINFNKCLCENITTISDHRCHCTGSNLIDIPQNLTMQLTILTIENAGLEVLKSTALTKYSRTLRILNLENLDKFYHIDPGVFENLHQLQSLYIYRAPKLHTILPEVFSVYLPKFTVMRITYTGLQHMPNLSGLKSDLMLEMVDLEHNKIRQIFSEEIRNVTLDRLILTDNEIEIVEEDAFIDSQIATINFRGNVKLKNLHPKAFHKIRDIRKLDFSNTSITYLPTEGLHEIETLKIENTYSLRKFPSVYNFKEITQASLTYPYHCCAFKYPKTQDQYEEHLKSLKELKKECVRRRLDPNNEINGKEYAKFFHEAGNLSINALCDYEPSIADFRKLQCTPKPDAFNPCEDLMGNWGLRIPVWIVVHSAVIGNLFVLIVIGTSQFRLTVSKFLMCNLAFADLCIGIHLLLLAGIDAYSIKEYFNVAIDWQEGTGCNIAGFLTIFGNVLSVYTLAVITLERWCTITWAAHLNRRLKLRTAVKIMILGWICALFMAFLPLQGISSYARTSICLPFKNENNFDLIYLSALLIFNCTAFTVICVCYGSMYRTIRSGAKSGIANSARNDQTVAKKMALLIFTDFACLSPIAFFGFSALLGYPLITVTQTKILLVFVYPLNSCANPCLYAILTRQYRKDFFILMGKLGICKEHANNFNRGAIRGKPVPYTAHFQKPHQHGVIRSISKCSNTTRNSLVTTVSNVNVEMPLNNCNGKIFENGYKKVKECKGCTNL